jgi:hypothetical protein
MYRQGIILTWLASASTLVSGTSDSDMIVVLRKVSTFPGRNNGSARILSYLIGGDPQVRFPIT